MPELPEVEIIVKGLSKKIVGKKIVDFRSLDKKVIQFETSDVVGKYIQDVKRRGKIIIIELGDNKTRSFDAAQDFGEKSLIIHLKLTGQFIWEPSGDKKEYRLRNRVAGGHPDKAWFESLPNKHTRGIFTFEDKSTLFFNDIRRFAYIKIFQTSDLKNRKIKELKDLGMDPFDKKFNEKYLEDLAQRFPNKKIKQYLMDQTIIAGVGNIYANEALFFAKVLPTRRLKDINESGWGIIVDSIIKSLKIGLKYGGTSDNNYVNSEGAAGSAQEHLKVYRREGEKCFECGSKVLKIKLGGRGTFYCPVCQK